jgi:hypothetical protein
MNDEHLMIELKNPLKSDRARHSTLGFADGNADPLA